MTQRSRNIPPPPADKSPIVPGWEPTAELPPTFDKIEPQTPRQLSAAERITIAREGRWDRAFRDRLHDLRRETPSNEQEWTWEHNVDCVVCPGCAFTFDSTHCDCEAGWPQYTCPVCGCHGPLIETT